MTRPDGSARRSFRRNATPRPLPLLGIGLAFVLAGGAFAAPSRAALPDASETRTETSLGLPPVRALSPVGAGRRPAAPQAEARPLGEAAPPPQNPSPRETSANGPAANGGPSSSKGEEPALGLFYLGTLGLPETSLARIARDLAGIGLPYTIRGLPWKSVPADPARTDVVRRETTLEDLTEPFNREKTPVHVDPRPFRALEAALRRDGFSGALPLPLWLVTLEGDAPAAEVLPGDRPPLCALGELLARSESPRLRERLRAEVLARLSDAARRELLVCADFAPDVRPRAKILSPE